jgi:hypothetical protein
VPKMTAWHFTVISLGSVLLTIPPRVAAQPRSFPDPPVVRSRLRVHWNAPLKALQWAADSDETFRAFPTNAVFLTNRSIFVVYPQLNPLAVQATVTSSPVADPSYTILTALLDTLTSLASTAEGIPGMSVTAIPPAPLSVAPGAAAEECHDPATDIKKLQSDLQANSPADVAKAVTAWPGIIDTSFAAGKTGPQSIADGVVVIKSYAASIDSKLTAAKKDWDQVKSCAATATDPLERAMYQAASLYDPGSRIHQVAALVSATNNLAASLDKQFGRPASWSNHFNDFVISTEIIPTYAQMQTTTVKVVTLNLSVNSSTGILSAELQLAGATTFNVRKIRR